MAGRLYRFTAQPSVELPWIARMVASLKERYNEMMGYTDKDIEVICELGRDPANWVPGGPEELEWARQAAQTLQDAYTEDDWRYVLNTLSAERAARKIGRRPVEQQDYLLGLLGDAQRAAVESHLAFSA